MGLFKKNNNKKELKELPELPKLPKLPELSDDFESEKTLPQLPRYPTTPLNNKFSQNIIRNEPETRNFLIPRRDRANSSFQEESQIKEAISGEKGKMFEADEFVREQMMSEQEVKPSDFARFNSEGEFEKSERGREQSRLGFPHKMEMPSKDFETRNWQESKTKKTGQVFIRIDKFEESLKIFEITKSKIVEMERTLEDIKKLKEKEEKELSYWMAEIQTIKNQTEKVEKDIFSKLE